MKLYNNILRLSLVGIVALTSCSQDENLGSALLSDFSISVTDTGFSDVSGSRAMDNNFKTTFVSGDAIGVYAVEDGSIVEGVENRKFTLNDKGDWVLDGNSIEYDSERFKNITFYAYYPYQESVTFDAAGEDPFSSLVNGWTIKGDQNASNYTKNDLMTSCSKAEDGRLQGKVNFAMNHRMALAVLKMPNLVYDFTNGGIDDYSLNVAPKELFVNDVETNPYYDSESGTYMALVKPDAEYIIKGSYVGAKEMEFGAEGSLSEGKAKMYTINDANKIDYTLKIGDYLCADGNLVSVDAGTVPDNAIGVVCYVGNPQPHVTHPDNYTETNDALYRDYPNCSHGIVLSLKNATCEGASMKMFRSGKAIYGDWFLSDEEWTGKFDNCNTANGATLPENRYPAFLGYNNTTLLTMCYEGKGSTSACDWAYKFLKSFREETILPSSTTPWYIPSIMCWDQVAANLTVINKSVTAADGDELTSVAANAITGHYWSSTQRNEQFQWTHGMDGGKYAITCERDSRAGYFRMMAAF